MRLRDTVGMPLSWNNTTVPLLAPAIGITAVELWIQLVLFYGLFSLVSLAGNIALAVCIARNKQFRARFFTILWFVVVARALFSFQFLIFFIHRALRTLDIVSTSLKGWQCYLLNVHAYYSSTLEMVLLLGIVLDRTLAILAFKYYRTLTYRHAITTCVVASAVTVTLKLGSSLCGAVFSPVIPCVNTASPVAPLFNTYHLNLDMTLAVMILIMYLALMCHIRFWYLPKLRAVTEQSGNNPAMESFKQQSRLLPFIQRIVLIHCGLTLSNKVIGSLSTFAAPQVALRMAALGGQMICIDLLANLVVLLVSNKELRQAVFSCKANKAPTALFQLVPTLNVRASS